MRNFSWLVVVCVVLTSSVSRAEERGALSVVGLTLAALGVGGLGVGVAGFVSGSTLDATIAAYPVPLPQADAQAVSGLLSRRDGATVTAAVGFGLGAALLVSGVVCLVLDAPKAPLVTLVPTRDGAVLAWSLRWP